MIIIPATQCEGLRMHLILKQVIAVHKPFLYPGTNPWKELNFRTNKTDQCRLLTISKHVVAGQWEMFNKAMKGELLCQSRSPHCSQCFLLQALCWSAWWRAWRGPRCPPVTRYGHCHTPSHSHSLLGGCHVDKLHRHGPRDHGTGLRGVSHSVSGKRRRPKHRKSETPAILWLTRFDFKYNLTTWPHKARMSFGFKCWFL